jgi:CheY-like chemotaxis protein
VDTVAYKNMNKKESATVLVVDDDSFVLDLVKDHISKYGYQAILASSGEEALQVAKKIKLTFCSPIL